MSRPGDTGHSMTRYEACADGTKRIRTVPIDPRIIDLIDIALGLGRCNGQACRAVGMYHEAGECRWLVGLENLVSEMDGVEAPFASS